VRESTARAAALGTGVLVLAAVVVFAIVQQQEGVVASPAAVPLAAPSEGVEAEDTILARGRGVYAEQGCAACHSIAGAGSPRSPLDGVGARLSSEQIRLWIVDPQAARPGVRKPAYDDLSPADLRALVAYLRSLR
jgi:mono/diheme cytochrome c family protein